MKRCFDIARTQSTRDCAFQLKIIFIVVSLDEILFRVFLHFFNCTINWSLHVDNILQAADWILFQFFLKFTEKSIYVFPCWVKEFKICISGIFPLKISDENLSIFKNFETLNGFLYCIPTYVVFKLTDIISFVKNKRIMAGDRVACDTWK